MERYAHPPKLSRSAELVSCRSAKDQLRTPVSTYQLTIRPHINPPPRSLLLTRSGQLPFVHRCGSAAAKAIRAPRSMASIVAGTKTERARRIQLDHRFDWLHDRKLRHFAARKICQAPTCAVHPGRSTPEPMRLRQRRSIVSKLAAARYPSPSRREQHIYLRRVAARIGAVSAHDPDCPSRFSISARSRVKSTGLVSTPIAPPSMAFRFVSGSP